MTFSSVSGSSYYGQKTQLPDVWPLIALSLVDNRGGERTYPRKPEREQLDGKTRENDTHFKAQAKTRDLG